jgi:excisionase family DNA binding protein
MSKVEPEFISAPELGERLGISRSGAYVLLDKGAVQSIRVGHRRLVAVEEADRYVEELRAQAQEPVSQPNTCQK